ncbi:MAG: hypothetical protein DHS20C14_08640 [Phycisphaeraceae bacterium]|nr:MAG: hypothetical protein DHS20C14_08640 [Phycisphaeraceae bacterium]
MSVQTVLLVDDEPLITHVVSRKLESAGYATVIARDGEEALRVALDAPPNLVVTDLQMPRMSGIEFATRLRHDERTSEIPVILLTARGYFLNPTEIELTNIREVMSKPFTARGLLAKVTELMGDDDAQLRGAA